MQFDGFLEELYMNGASKKTIAAYQKDLQRFARWYKDNAGKEIAPGDITGFELRGYQEYLQEEKELMPATVNRYLISVNRWLVWAKKTGCIKNVPPSPKQVAIQKSRPKSLQKWEQNRLLQEAEKGKSRDLALIRVFLSCGLRVSEAVSLKKGDLELGPDYGKITVRKGKGNKWREVPVPFAARKVLEKWLVEVENKHPGCKWLFPTRNGNPVGVRQTEQMIQRLARQAGIKCSPHILRHTCASNMLHAGVDLVAVAEILGHSSLDTTAIYTLPSEDKMMQAVEKGEK